MPTFGLKKTGETVNSTSVSEQPHVECGSESLTVRFKTKSAFEGHSYVKGHYRFFYSLYSHFPTWASFSLVFFGWWATIWRASATYLGSTTRFFTNEINCWHANFKGPQNKKVELFIEKGCFWPKHDQRTNSNKRMVTFVYDLKPEIGVVVKDNLTT